MQVGAVKFRFFVSRHHESLCQLGFLAFAFSLLFFMYIMLHGIEIPVKQLL